MHTVGCSMCLTDLYVKLLNHNIAHVTYDAEIAGLRFACFQSMYFIHSYILEPASVLYALSFGENFGNRKHVVLACVL